MSPGEYQVLTEVKESAAKRRRQSTRLENLGIPEEELLRQQQELFAKVGTAESQQSPNNYYDCRLGNPPCSRSEHSWSRWTTLGVRTVEGVEVVGRIRRTRPVRRSQNLSALHLFIISLEEYNKIKIDLTLIN